MTEPEAIITWHERTRFTVNSTRPLSDDEVEVVKEEMRRRAAGRFLLMDEAEWAVSASRTSVGGATCSPMFKPMPVYVPEDNDEA